VHGLGLLWDFCFLVECLDRDGRLLFGILQRPSLC
jgi:hypothetical protein